MKKSRQTKRALIPSVLAVILCVAMLVGTTFAWFTDTASTSVNKIQAGELKVGLEMANGTNDDGSTKWVDAEGATLNFKKATGAPENEAVLWEPGCTYELPAIRVVNNGNLAFKYKFVINGIDGDAELLKAIDFTVKFNDEEVNLDTWEGKLLPEGKTAGTGEETKTSSSLVISGHMKEDAGNTYQGLSIEGISVTVYAAQYTYEFDSINNQYDLSSSYVFDDYVNVTAAVKTDGDTVIQDNDAAPTIKATIPQDSTTATNVALIKKPTANPDSVKVEAGQSALTTDVKIIDTATSNVISAADGTYFTIEIQLGQVDLQKFYHKGVELEKVESFNAADQYKYDYESGVVTFTTKDFSTFTAVFKFAGGNGTEDTPYLIATKEHFQALNTEYTNSKFNYYKIADGVSTLDLSDVGKVSLYGVFDGNNATITTNQRLFNIVGITDSTQTPSVIKNMTVNEDHSDSALVFTVIASELTFESVKVSGSIERDYHGAAFVEFGSANVDDTGKDYTVSFKNCSCDAKIATRAENTVSILVAHPYQGSGHTATIRLDSATDSGIDGAKLYTPAGTGGNKYYGNDSWTVSVYVGDSTTNAGHGTFSASAIGGTTAPVKAENAGYTVTPVEGATSIRVKVLSQLTAYDNNGDEINNLNGITFTNGTCYNQSVSGIESVTVFGTVNSVEIVNGLTASGYPEYTLAEDGKLTIKTNDTNYLTGTVRLAAYQYDSNGALISVGTLDIASSTGTPSEDNVNWTVK